LTDRAGFDGIVVTTGFLMVDFLLFVPSNLFTNVEIYGNDNTKPKPGIDRTTEITTGKNPPNNL
jgi:hypothetical protein